MIDAKSFAHFSSLSKCGIDLPKTWNFSLTYYMIKKTIEVLKCEPICWVSSAYSPWRMRTSIWNVVWMRTGLSGRDITDTEQCDTVKQKKWQNFTPLFVQPLTKTAKIKLCETTPLFDNHYHKHRTAYKLSDNTRPNEPKKIWSLS